MFKDLKIEGTLKGSFQGKAFQLECHTEKIKVRFEEIGLIKELKQWILSMLQDLKAHPLWNEAMESFAVEIYLKEELIVKLGKEAKSSFISSMLGLKNIEVVSNSIIYELM